MILNLKCTGIKQLWKKERIDFESTDNREISISIEGYIDAAQFEYRGLYEMEIRYQMETKE